jgi:hypothetical protein
MLRLGCGKSGQMTRLARSCHSICCVYAEIAGLALRPIQTHNPKVASSNLAPATTKNKELGHPA